MVTTVDISPTLAINQRSQELIAAGKQVYKLGFGQSPFAVPDIVVEALRTYAHKKEYLPTQGLPLLREAIADHCSQLYDDQIQAGQIVIGPGSKELLYLLQLAIGRHLILPSPSWVSYAPQAQICNTQTHWLDSDTTNDWIIDQPALDKCTKKQGLLLVNYPNNPTGQIWSPQSMETVASFCQEQDHIILSDEIYGELTFDQLHRSIYNIAKDRTIITSGLSKWCGAGGWRLGYAIVPKTLDHIKERIVGFGSEVYSCASAPIQYAAITAFSNHPSIEDYKLKTKFILKTISDYVYEQLLTAHIVVSKPKGGFYNFPSFENYRHGLGRRGIYNSTSLCERLLEETGVALLPGVAFGRPPSELTARLSFVDFDGTHILKTIEETHSLKQENILTNCPQITNGIRTLIKWLHRS